MSEPQKIEVFEAGSDEEMVMLAMLNTAKHMHEDHPEGVQPHAFVFGADMRLVVVNLANFGDYNEVRVRDEIAVSLREIAKEQRAHFIGFLSDVWRTLFDDPRAIEADGLRCEDYRDWSEAAKQRHPFVRREALFLAMESRAGNKYLSQFYRRAGKRIVWEEIFVDDHDVVASGRFIDMLPRED
jgi:hypothetical protein